MPFVRRNFGGLDWNGSETLFEFDGKLHHARTRAGKEMLGIFASQNQFVDKAVSSTAG